MFRRKPRVFPAFVVEEEVEESTPSILMIPRRAEPSWATGFARTASDALHPELWDGLVGAWSPGLGPTGAALYDVSGNGKDGSLLNMDPAAAWVVDRLGYSIQFAGVNQVVSLGEPLIPQSGPFSVVNLFRTSATHRGAVISQYIGSQEGRLILYGTDSSNANKARLFIGLVGGSIGITSDAATNDGKWHSVAITREGDTFSIFLDGVFQSSDSIGGATVLQSRNTWLGAAEASTINFSGLESNTAIYNRVLSHPEISLLASDPDAMFRRKPRIFPASTAAAGGPSLITVFIVEAGSSTETTSVVMLSPQSVSELAQSDDTVQTTLMGLVSTEEGVQSDDTITRTIIALVAVAEDTSSTDSFGRVITSPQSIVEGAESSDTDIASLLMLVDIIEGGESGDSGTVPGDLTGAVVDGAQSGDTYSNLLLAAAILTEGSSSSDILARTLISPQSVVEAAQSGDSSTRVLTTIVTVVEDSQSSDLLTTIGIFGVSIDEGVTSDDTYGTTSTVIANISESVSSSDTFGFQSVPITTIIAATFILPARVTTFTLPRRRG
jgi:hypothetical protein